MQVYCSQSILNTNIERARTLANPLSVSLMFKEYYEGLFPAVKNNVCDIYASNLANCVNYIVGGYNKSNRGSIITNINDAHKAYNGFGIKRMVIPIDNGDCREGLSLTDACTLSTQIRRIPNSVVDFMVTNGCINSSAETDSLFYALSDKRKFFRNLSLGGSLFLSLNTKDYPEYVKDIRIGRSMLFGSIPCTDERIGASSLFAKCKVLQTYPERNMILTDLGDAYVNPHECVALDSDVTLKAFSSNYSVFYTKDTKRYAIGSRLSFALQYEHSSALSKLHNKFVIVP